MICDSLFNAHIMLFSFFVCLTTMCSTSWTFFRLRPFCTYKKERGKNFIRTNWPRSPDVTGLPHNIINSRIVSSYNAGQKMRLSDGLILSGYPMRSCRKPAESKVKATSTTNVTIEQVHVLNNLLEPDYLFTGRIADHLTPNSRKCRVYGEQCPSGTVEGNSGQQCVHEWTDCHGRAHTIHNFQPKLD